MNIQLTPPPDRDLRPAVRDRQRDELIAIVDHESVQNTPRRRLAPLAAAAAVVAVTAGLAIGVPALRGDKAQPPVSGPGTSAAQPAVAPLTEVEKKVYAKGCNNSGARVPGAAAKYTVKDGFKWVDPASGTHALAWVVLADKALGRSFACGFDAKGHKTAAGGGTYARSVARVTVAFGTGPAVEAVLRNGFFFAPMKYEDTRGPLKPNAAPTYTVRAYGADGQVIYASPSTVREQQAEINSCYTNPEGTKVDFYVAGKNGTPPVSQCKRGVAWTW